MTEIGRRVWSWVAGGFIAILAVIGLTSFRLWDYLILVVVAVGSYIYFRFTLDKPIIGPETPYSIQEENAYGIHQSEHS